MMGGDILNEIKLMNAIKSLLDDTYEKLNLVNSDMDEVKVVFAYRMSTILGQCYSKNDVTDIVTAWKDSTDEEFVEMICDVCDTMTDANGACSDSVLDAFCNIKKLQQAQTLDECNHNGNMMLPMEIKCLKQSKDDMLAALDICGYIPTDRVCISQECLDDLKTLWLKDDTSDYAKFVPSDIIFSKKVSVLDMEIVIDDNPNSLIQPMRVTISEDYQDLLDKYSDKDGIITIGCLSVPIEGSDKTGFVFPIGVIPGFDCICIDMEPVMYGLQQSLSSSFFESFRPHEGGMLRICTILMQYWYSLQLSMMHPVMKYLYTNKRKIKDRRKYMLGNKCEKLVRHMNCVNVTAVKMNELWSSANFDRTSSSYVVGHWRTYKTGKKSFVSPYWKGDNIPENFNF